MPATVAPAPPSPGGGRDGAAGYGRDRRPVRLGQVTGVASGVHGDHCQVVARAGYEALGARASGADAGVAHRCRAGSQRAERFVWPGDVEQYDLGVGIRGHEVGGDAGAGAAARCVVARLADDHGCQRRIQVGTVAGGELEPAAEGVAGVGAQLRCRAVDRVQRVAFHPARWAPDCRRRPPT